MDEKAIRAECLNILSQMKELKAGDTDRLGGDEAADLDLVNLSFDSLTLLEFCMQLEEKTGLIVEPADLLEVTSLNLFVKQLASRTGAAAAA